MANKQLLQSAGDGTTVPSGYVGEMFGTLRNATNGSTYSIQSSTGVSANVATDVISTTLNSGIYLISFKLRCNYGASSVQTVRVAVGGTIPVTSYETYYAFGSGGEFSMAHCLPIIINGSNVSVAIRLTSGSSSTFAQHEMFVIRLA
jgi:hypothetical protein